MKLILLTIIMQVLFSTGDILARKQMKKPLPYWKLLLKPWILGLILLHIGAISTYFYLMHEYNLSRIAVLSSSMAMFLSVLCGSLYLKEEIKLKQLLAVSLIVLVIVVQGMG